MDDKFIDQAWEQMRQALDREMPVERKRRRLVMVPWVWGAAASIVLLISIGLGWWLWQQPGQHDPAMANVQQATEMPIAATEDCEQITPPKQEAIAQNSAARQLENKMPIPADETAKASDFIVKRNTSKVGTEKRLAAKTSVNELVAGNTIPNSASVETAEIATLENRNTATQNQIPANTLAKTEAVQPLSSAVIAELENAAVTNLPKPKVDLNMTAPVIDVEKNTSNWNIGLEFAAFSSPTAPVTGFSGGAVVQVSVTGDKLRLRTGLSYSNRQNMIDVQAGSETAMALESADQPDQSFTGSSVSIAEPDFSMTTHQLNLPAIFEYKPHKNFGIEGGLNGSYLVTARNLEGVENYQRVMGGNSTVSNSARNFVNTLQADQGNNKINIDQLYRWDVMATAGLSVYPSQKLGVRFQYQRGLRDMLKDNDFEAFSNNFRVSAVYFFR